MSEPQAAAPPGLTSEARREGGVSEAAGGERIIIENCSLATMDGAGPQDTGAEYASGHLVISGDRIVSVGPGPAPHVPDGARRIDGAGALVTPGLVNTHHHLFQWLTQGMARDDGLFDWLTELYPVWTRIDAQDAYAAASAGLSWLALAGCTTSADHHYLFPPRAGELLGATIEAAGQVGIRFHPARGSMDLGESDGGLPPDDAVEDTGTALEATSDAIERWHDPSPGSMVRVAVAPCSPFSASGELMREGMKLARVAGVRMHTHLAETLEEDLYCRQRTGCSPAEYLDELGWLGDDVWLAHCVHLDERGIERLSFTGTSVAHCPSSNGRLGSGIAPVRRLLRSGAAVGLGVDGPASSEGSTLVTELRQALLAARVRDGDGATALTARQALWLATRGGAACLGRAGEIGALAPGMLADVAMWRLDGLGQQAIGDPVTALVLAPPPRAELVLAGGRAVVDGGELRTVSEQAAAAAAGAARRRLLSQVRR
jgi:cytosine/adenosine deaminase-related metal-dependent hydrolase